MPIDEVVAVVVVDLVFEDLHGGHVESWDLELGRVDQEVPSSLGKVVAESVVVVEAVVVEAAVVDTAVVEAVVVVDLDGIYLVKDKLVVEGTDDKLVLVVHVEAHF